MNNNNTSDTTSRKSAQFFKLTADRVKQDYLEGGITAEYYILYLIDIHSFGNIGWTLDVADATERWGIPKRTYYRAIDKLKSSGKIKISGTKTRITHIRVNAIRGNAINDNGCVTDGIKSAMSGIDCAIDGTKKAENPCGESISGTHQINIDNIQINNKKQIKDPVGDVALAKSPYLDPNKKLDQVIQDPREEKEQNQVSNLPDAATLDAAPLEPVEEEEDEVYSLEQVKQALESLPDPANGLVRLVMQHENRRVVVIDLLPEYKQRLIELKSQLSTDRFESLKPEILDDLSDSIIASFAVKSVRNSNLVA